MSLPANAYSKFNLDTYRAIIHKDDLKRFYESIKNFSPLQGRRISSINPGYQYHRFDIVLAEEELVFLKLQLSKSTFWSQAEIDNEYKNIVIDEL